MTDVLRQKILRLIRDEDGVALVVTLALFMFLYVSCAGVFAVGRTVKNRVLLQNAADAAAGSAAVVQTDALSRIAVLNREMAFVYTDMIRRQRDYVILTWLQKAYDGYKADRASRYEVYGDAAGTRSRQMNLNGTVMSESEVEGLLADLPDLEAGIATDSARLQTLREEAETLLDELPDEAEKAAAYVLNENLSGWLGRHCLRKTAFEAADWWTTETNEADFLAGALVEADGAADLPAEGWFMASGDDICRVYEPGADGNVAQWWYRVSPSSPVVPQTPVRSDALDAASRPLVAFAAGDTRFTARPVRLAEDYFPSSDGAPGKGAVTVGVAHRTDNPWRFGETALDGLYDVFAPVSEHVRWARAVASAQAGYAVGGAGEAAAYSLAWADGGRQSLFTNDWNAVYLPVRRALTAAAFAEFVGTSAGWEKALATGEDALLVQYETGLGAGTALPLMHGNAGADSRLDWGADGAYPFLDLMFH